MMFSLVDISLKYMLIIKIINYCYSTYVIVSTAWVVTSRYGDIQEGSTELFILITYHCILSIINFSNTILKYFNRSGRILDK